MSNRKIKSGEQKIINLINANVENVNLDYSNIRDFIVLETEKSKEETSSRNHFYFMAKYIVACSFLFACVAIFIFAISNHQLLINESLTNYVMNLDQNYTYKYDNSEVFKETELYSVIDDKQTLSNTMVVEVDMPKVDKGEIYCAYLSNEMISVIENYSFDNDYLIYKDEILYNGIDDLLSKYYYYCHKKNIETSIINSNLKWVKFNNKKVKSSINDSQLVFVSIIRNIEEAYDINTKQLIDVDIKCVVEVDSTNLSKNYSICNLEYNTNGGKYLFNILDDIQRKQYYSDEFFSNNSALVEKIDGKLVVKGIIPTGYKDYITYEIYKNYAPSNECYEKLTKWLNDLEGYLLYSKEYVIRGSQTKLCVNYYDYSVIEFLIR